MRKRGTARGAAQVVVIGVDDRGMGLIRECLGTEAVLPTHATAYHDAGPMVRKTRPNVVVMGFDGDFDEAVRLGPVLTSETPGVQLVAISEQTDPERIRSAMRAGYREYVVLPEDAALLRQAVHEAAYASTEVEDQGEVIAVVGSKGGVGNTLLTTNLAAELSPVHRVAAVDLVFSMGDLASFLDLEPKSSIVDVINNLDRMDERMLVGSVTVHPSKMHVLAQPTQISEGGAVSGDDVLRVLTACADAYQYVLVDCGTAVNEATTMTTTVADRIMLVCSPDVAAVRNAWRRLQFFDRLGIDREIIRLVVNKWGKGAELKESDIEGNLGMKIAARISADPTNCDKAVNTGRLLRDLAPKSPTAIDISAAVDLITTDAAQVESKAPGKGLFGRFF